MKYKISKLNPLIQNEKYTEQFNINCRKRSRLALFTSIDVNFIQTEHVRYYYYKFIIKL